MAAFAISAVGASAASAAGGPFWIVKCHKVLAGNVAESRWNESACKTLSAGGGFDTRLLAGENQAINSKNNSGPSGVFKLKTSVLTIECKTEKDPGELIGGNPGKDTATVTFGECAEAGKTVAECGAASGATAGVVTFGVKTVLGYPLGKPETETEAYDQFFPTSGSLFVTFTLSGTNCGLLNKQKVEVKATGPTNCGVISTLGKIVEPEEKFVVTKSGEETEVGALRFPEKPPTEETVWNGTAFETVKCGLEAVDILGTQTAEEIGVAQVQTSPIGPFGWEK